MSQRRILLIDNDRAFHRLMSDQLAPYGLEVVAANPTDADVLGKVTQLQPALIIIAVDEPDKVGYSLCNKARKGAAATLPIVLVTSSVAPQGFANHRKLKFHADEYIDKRGLNPAEVVGKIDNLIGLGEADELQIPVEVDDVPLDLGDAEVVEQLDDSEFSEEASRTGVRAVDSMIDADLDGAFAAITDFGDDAPPPPPAEAKRGKRGTEAPPPPPLRGKQQPVPLPPLEEVEVARPSTRKPVAPTPAPVSVPDAPSDFIDVEPSMGVPEPIDPPHDLEAVEDMPSAEWSAGEIPEPIDMGDFDQEEATSAGGPPLADMLRMAEARPVNGGLPGVEEPEPEMISMSAIELPSEEELAPQPLPLEDPIPELLPDSVAAPERVPEPPIASEPEIPPPSEPEIPAELPPTIQLEVPAPPPAPVDAGLDFGLEEVEAKARDEQSGVHDRRTLQKLHVLERDNAKLKAELEKLRAAGEGGKTQGKEREFLHLREMIGTKDKEILELRDELVVKDRQILDGKEKIRTLQHAKAQMEGKNLELEQRIVGDAERVEAADSVRKELEVQLADVTAKLAAVEARAKTDLEAATRALTDRTAQATTLDKELTTARGRIVELERQHAETVSSLARNHDAAEQELRAELANARDEAVEAARAELIQAHAADLDGVKTAHAQALATRDADHASALAATTAAHQAKVAELEERHGGAIAAVVADADATLAAERARAETALAGERARAETEIAAERDRATRALTEAERQLAATVAEAQAAAEKAIADAQATAQQELAQVITSQQGEIDQLSGAHARALTEARAQTETQLAAARAAAIAERDRLVDEHGAAVTALTADRDGVAEELATARAEIDRVGGELAALADRARKDFAAAAEQARHDVEAAHAARDAALASLRSEHDDVLAAARAETAQMSTGLGSAREQIRALEAELAAAREATAARQRDVEAQAAAVAERDQRLVQLKTDLDALEQENAGYQEQVLKAYQKIKADESTVARAKKAMAIAMTLLDEEKAKAGS